ncbi:MAG: hypothetical protein ACO3FE_00885, partial [Planctomycetaceae bacterium]
LDVVRASHLSLHRDCQLGEPGHQPRPHRVVPNQRFVGVPHDALLGGHDGDGIVQSRTREALDRIRKINTFHTTQLAYLLEKLASVEEGDGTLLDHCMIAYGSGIHDGNAHNHEDLPLLLAGGGCGTLQTGRHVRYRTETPLTNLWLAMLNRMEVDWERLGDSTEVLTGLL